MTSSLFTRYRACHESHEYYYYYVKVMLAQSYSANYHYSASVARVWRYRNLIITITMSD